MIASLLLFVFNIQVFIANDIDGPSSLKALQLATKDINANTAAKLKISSVFRFDAPSWQPSQPGALERWENEYFRIKNSLFDPMQKKPKTIYVYLIAPQYNFINQQYLYGVTQGECINPPTLLYATAAGKDFISVQKTRYIIEHELLHILGAKHEEGRSVMTPGNDNYVWSLFPYLKILKVTRRLVDACIKMN